MSEPRLTSILISIIFVGLIVSGLAVFLSGTASTYGGDVDGIEDEFVSTFVNESRATTDRLEVAREQLDTVEEDKNLLDRLGSFFRSGYDTARALLGSINSVTRLINQSIGQLPFMGSFGVILAASLSIIVLIVVIGIFMHFLIKSERI